MLKNSINRHNELLAKEALKKYLSSIGQSNVKKNVRELMDVQGGFAGRFDFFIPLLNNSSFKSIFVSGCSVGSELMLAKIKKFKEVVGLEVDPGLFKICKLRINSYKNLKVFLSRNGTLPEKIKSRRFTFVYSGHVIEHTVDPCSYFIDHLNLLDSGGFFFLEFPNRYNLIELHTGTISFEWFPPIMRKFFLSLMVNIYQLFNQKKAILYLSVKETLKPISINLIKHFIRKSGRDAVIVSVQYPLKGYVRILLRVN